MIRNKRQTQVTKITSPDKIYTKFVNYTNTISLAEIYFETTIQKIY